MSKTEISTAYSADYIVEDGNWVLADFVRTYGGNSQWRHYFGAGTRVAIRQRRFVYPDGHAEVRCYHVCSLTSGVWSRPILNPDEVVAELKTVRNADGKTVAPTEAQLAIIAKNSERYSWEMSR